MQCWPQRQEQTAERRLWNFERSLRVLVAEGLAASVGAGSALGRRSGFQALPLVPRPTGGVEETELAG